MADEIIPAETVVEPIPEVVEPVVPIVPPGIDPADELLLSPISGGNLVTNAGRLLWVSPAGTRTIIAGA